MNAPTPRPSPLGPPRYVLGVDLGGTKISVGAMRSSGGHAIALRSEPTRAEEGADAVVARIAAMLNGVMAEAGTTLGATRDQFAGVGIGSPGPLDRARGLVITTPNLGWHDFPLRDRVASAVRLPATLDNRAGERLEAGIECTTASTLLCSARAASVGGALQQWNGVNR